MFIRIKMRLSPVLMPRRISFLLLLTVHSWLHMGNTLQALTYIPLSRSKSNGAQRWQQANDIKKRIRTFMGLWAVDMVGEDCSVDLWPQLINW